MSGDFTRAFAGVSGFLHTLGRRNSTLAISADFAWAGGYAPRISSRKNAHPSVLASRGGSFRLFPGKLLWSGAAERSDPADQHVEDRGEQQAEKGHAEHA